MSRTAAAALGLALLAAFAAVYHLHTDKVFVQYIQRNDVHHLLSTSNVVLVVGGSLKGAVVADVIARFRGKKVLVVERKPYLGGRCHDFVDNVTGLLRARGAPCVFRASNLRTWKYMSRFSDWIEYDQRLTATIDEKVLPYPINIDTLNLFFNTHVLTAADARKFLAVQSGAKLSSEDRRKVLFERFHAYSLQPWASALGGMDTPVHIRTDWDDRLFPGAIFSGLPRFGFTKWFENAFAHPNIHVLLDTDFFDLLDSGMVSTDLAEFDKVYYTGNVEQLLQKRGFDLQASFEYLNLDLVDRTWESLVTNTSDLIVDRLFGSDKNSQLCRSIEHKQFWQQSSIVTTVTTMCVSETVGDRLLLNTSENYHVLQKFKNVFASDPLSHKIDLVSSFDDSNLESDVMLVLEQMGDSKVFKSVDSLTVSSRSYMKIHIVVNVFREDISWISRICHAIRWNFGLSVSIRFFLYSKDPNADLHQLQTQVYRLLSYCQTSDERTRNFFAKLPNVGREGHTWLEYMTSASFDFGDLNLFIQGGFEAKQNVVLDTIRAVKLHLFNREATRASQHAVYSRDIYNVPSYPSAPSLRELLSVDIDDSLPIQHHLHYHSFHRVHQNYDECYQIFEETKERLDAIKASFCKTFDMVFSRETNSGTNCESIPVSYRGEFAVTEAAIRRMLSKYRIQAIQLQRILEEGNDPIIGHALERLWLRMFRYR